jgi:elongation factor P hydroxylase
MIDSPALNKLLDDLITQKHGADISPEVHEELKNELSPRLEKWLILKAMDAIAKKSAEDLKTFQDMVLQDESNEKVMGFIREKIPDTDAFFTQALLDFWNTYVHPENTLT